MFARGLIFLLIVYNVGRNESCVLIDSLSRAESIGLGRPREQRNIDIGVKGPNC